VPEFAYVFIGFVVGLVCAILWLRKKPVTDDADTCGQLEELSKLTGALAHEIKNPLSSVKVNLKLAEEELRELAEADSGGKSNVTARVVRKVGVVRQEAERVEHILARFLQYLDRTEPQLARTDINEIVSDMVDFYTPQARSHSITIRHTLSERPLTCRVDADMLKQAILNLFINALQAMDDGGELMVRTDVMDAEAVIQISDTGCGIPADKQAFVFDACYSSRPQGSGLGLPTARKIIESHHGKITVSSEPGKGTLFTIQLPLDN